MRIFKGKKTIAKVVIVVVFASLVGVLSLIGNRQKAAASATGPTPSHTGAPGENSCTVCHNQFPVNTGTGNITITGIPHIYFPGQQFQVRVTTSQADAVLDGFQLTAIDSAGREAGTFALPAASPAPAQIVSGNVGGNNRQYVEHTVDGLFTNGMFGSNSWDFTWTAPQRRIGKVGFYAAGNGANSDNSTTGDYIYTKATATLSGAAASNFDGDFQSDIAVFRPSNGFWYTYNIATGAFQAFPFGLPGDLITPGDFDGDGVTDFAVFRPSTGSWYVQRSTQGFIGVQFGASGDVPAAGDYDGDGKTDIAVYRPSAGVWYILPSVSGQITATFFGLNGDKPVPGDYDADGKTDIAVYRPSTGSWHVLRSNGGTTISFQFGISEDKPVQADYDGDGRTDVAVFRPSAGGWYIQKSRDGFFGVAFGLGADLPAPADYDGDGLADVAVFRPSSGAWYINRSSDNAFYATNFGLSGDVPVAGGYIPQ